MKENPVVTKSFAFALRIVKLYRHLVAEKQEYVLSKELLISGTNIGKHVKGAVNAEGKPVFISEMGIARRKASETEYWLQLLLFGEFISQREFDSIEADRQELHKILTSIVMTSRENA